MHESESEVAQSCPTLSDPMGLGSLYKRIEAKSSQASSSIMSNCISSVQFSRSVVSDSATPWTAAHQAPLSMGFSRQEHWSGLPFPSPMHESEK